MKKSFFILSALLFFTTLNAEEPADWSCENDSDCSAGMVCNTNVCRMDDKQFAKYVALTLSFGENNPNSRGSDRIFVQHPAQDLVVGQLAIRADSGDKNEKYYLIKQLLIDLSAYPAMKFENFKLVRDKNGNALFDPSEVVVSEGVVSGNSVTFNFNQKLASYKVNSTENFLIVGSFNSGKDKVDSIWKFYAIVKYDYITAKANGSDASVAETPPLSFPSFSFEPTNNYFL